MRCCSLELSLHWWWQLWIRKTVLDNILSLNSRGISGIGHAVNIYHPTLWLSHKAVFFLRASATCRDEFEKFTGQQHTFPLTIPCSIFAATRSPHLCLVQSCKRSGANITARFAAMPSHVPSGPPVRRATCTHKQTTPTPHLFVSPAAASSSAHARCYRDGTIIVSFFLVSRSALASPLPCSELKKVLKLRTLIRWVSY